MDQPSRCLRGQGFPQTGQRAAGYLGEEPVLTPNLDRLAEQAIVFTRAASNYPVCSPFRAMLMTGQYTVQSSFAQRSRLRIKQIGR